MFTQDEFFLLMYIITNTRFKLLVVFSSSTSPSQIVCPPTTLQEAFNHLPPPLKWICGTVQFPCDNGLTIINNVTQSSQPTLFGTSDAASKNNRSTHTWIISSGDIVNINDPEKNISGARVVDSYDPYLSSSQAELTDLTMGKY